ncbi:UNVERIFIED_CONTAM: hypothetical protein Scaly_3117700, partial [Sesamum calycinum]
MEDVIEGGPWLFQGQPIVLQAWEQGMSLRRQKHNQIPVWVRLKHLPMEYWTDEGLSTVASGIGTPLYSDGITKIAPALTTPARRGWLMIKLASWNVRGLNGPDHQRAVEQVGSLGDLAYPVYRHFRRTLVSFRDFNAVIDTSEVYGRAADTSASMAEFCSCVRDTGLVQLPFTGCPFTWHNCSEGPRSLWKRLDRMLANVAWLDAWPGSSYISALPSTSDHSPLILTGMDRIPDRAIFRELDLEFLRRDLKHSITLAEATLLVAPVTHLEVKEAFFDIGERVPRARMGIHRPSIELHGL